MLNYTNAQFAMAIKDVWTPHDDGSTSFNSFKRGHIYQILDSNVYAGTRFVDSDRAKYFLPVGYYDRETNEFNKNFILVESVDSIVEPYTTILKLEKEKDYIQRKYLEEIRPICERRDDELKSIKTKINELEAKLK